MGRKSGPPNPRPTCPPRPKQDRLPGETEAKALGYEVYAYGGSKQTAYYYKGVLSLAVHSNGTAEISAHYKLIEIRTPNISFPHPRFQMFESQILSLLNGVS